MNFDDLDKNPYDKAAHDIYSLYFIGWLFGFLAFIIGFVLAIRQLNRSQVPDLYKSHYRFQLSIAWQGLMVFVGIILIWSISMPYLSWPEWWRGLLLTIMTVFLPIYWWVKRSIIGFNLLRNDQLIKNPNTFLWPKS